MVDISNAGVTNSTETPVTKGRAATVEELLNAYVFAEAENLKLRGKYAVGDEEMLRKEAMRGLASIWNTGQMSLFALELAAEKLVDNGGDSMGGDLEEALKVSKSKTNPFFLENA